MSAMRVSRCLTFPLSIGTVLIRHHGEAFLDPRTRALACLIDRMPLVVICVSLEYNLLSTLMIFFFSSPQKITVPTSGRAGQLRHKVGTAASATVVACSYLS
jgi:hypothetical protein